MNDSINGTVQRINVRSLPIYLKPSGTQLLQIYSKFAATSCGAFAATSCDAFAPSIVFVCIFFSGTHFICAQ